MFLCIFLCVVCAQFAHSDCPNGSFASFTDPSICYYFQSNKTDFMDAEGACRSLSGHVTSIHNMFENVFLSEKAKWLFTDSTESDFWFGLNDLLIPGNWTWTDNTPFDFNDWNKGQPQNVSGLNCGAVTMSDGKWTADDCFKIKPFVCIVKTNIDATTPIQPSTTPKPNICSEGWTFFYVTGFCYKVIAKSSTWWDAEMQCVKEKSHLISIHSWIEMLFATQLAAPYSTNKCDWNSQTWIGLSTTDENVHWNWTDGTAFDYTIWAPGMPNNPGKENCGLILTGIPCNGMAAAVFHNWICNNLVDNFICKTVPQSL